jgi:hypothetical protein
MPELERTSISSWRSNERSMRTKLRRRSSEFSAWRHQSWAVPCSYLPTLPLKGSPNEINSHESAKGAIGDWPQKYDAAAKFSAPETRAFRD